jgi:hypothetical protein
MVSVSHAYIRIYSLSPSVEGKPKRPPTAYNLFVKEHMKNYLAENPGKTNKDAMKHVRPILPLVLLFTHSHFQIGALWKDAPENPRRGQAVKERPPRRHRSGQRRLSQRILRVRMAPRSSLAVTNERSCAHSSRVRYIIALFFSRFAVYFIVSYP